MVYVNDIACDGCGVCMDICPTDALIFQNNRAFINQDFCHGCELCLDTCPKGAIVVGEMQPAAPAVIQMPEVPSLAEPADQTGLRGMVLPAIGSLLLWTGRELVPRLADAALGYLDQRIQSSQSPAPQQLDVRGTGQESRSTSRSGRGRRRQRHRRNRRFF
jgi:ferredoxin